MIQIQVFRLLDQTACSISFYREPIDKPAGDHRQWTSLSYASGPPLAHDETSALLNLVHEAIEKAERHAAEHGGWSALD